MESRFLQRITAKWLVIVMLALQQGRSDEWWWCAREIQGSSSNNTRKHNVFIVVPRCSYLAWHMQQRKKAAAARTMQKSSSRGNKLRVNYFFAVLVCYCLAPVGPLAHYVTWPHKGSCALSSKELIACGSNSLKTLKPSRYTK